MFEILVTWLAVAVLAVIVAAFGWAAVAILTTWSLTYGEALAISLFGVFIVKAGIVLQD